MVYSEGVSVGTCPGMPSEGRLEVLCPPTPSEGAPEEYCLGKPSVRVLMGLCFEVQSVVKPGNLSARQVYSDYPFVFSIL